MMGYGSEDEHFVLELTYNYTVHSYELGNDFHVCFIFGWKFKNNLTIIIKGIHIESDDVMERVKTTKPILKHEDGTLEVWDPDGHSFFVRGGTSKHPLKKITLNTMDLCKTKG